MAKRLSSQDIYRYGLKDTRPGFDLSKRQKPGQNSLLDAWRRGQARRKKMLARGAEAYSLNPKNYNDIFNKYAMPNLNTGELQAIRSGFKRAQKKGAKPAAPGATPGAPANPGAPAANAPPPDPMYDARASALARNKNLSDAQITYEEGRTKQEYGFDDPSNPFSRARMLERAYKQQQARTLNSGASRGQLYAGALQNASTSDRFTSEKQTDATRRQYDDQLAQFAQRRAQNAAEYQSGLDEEGAARVGRAADAARAEDPTGMYDEPAILTTGTGKNAKGQTFTRVVSGGWLYHRYANGKKVKVRKV